MDSRYLPLADDAGLSLPKTDRCLAWLGLAYVCMSVPSGQDIAVLPVWLLE